VRYGLPEEERPVWEGVAEEGSELARTLERMREIDPNFDARHFMEGAKVAYEMIVTAFAEGDEKTLKPLLAPDIFEQFAAAIDTRKSGGLTQELEFVGLDEATLKDARLDGTTARMTVKFVSKVITATRDANGEVVEGNPEKLTTVREIWTFERDLTSRDPNWRLVATEAAR
jgi:predicted lipid-binding transport protein (Tim44 family)